MKISKLHSLLGKFFFGLTPTPTSKPKVVKIGLCITMISYQGNLKWLFHRNLVSCFSFILNGEHQQQIKFTFTCVHFVLQVWNTRHSNMENIFCNFYLFFCFIISIVFFECDVMECWWWVSCSWMQRKTNHQSLNGVELLTIFTKMWKE